MSIKMVNKHQVNIRVQNLVSAFEIHYKHKISKDLLDRAITLAEFAASQPNSQELLYLILDQGLVMAALQEMEKAKAENKTPEPEADYEGIMSRSNNSVN